MAIDISIGLFCAASCSQLNASKSQAFLVQSQPPASATVSALPSISFITGQQAIKHLGARLGYDMPAACIQTFSSIHQAIRAKVTHWSARGLSFLGRVYVARQVLAASIRYHATFQRPPDHLRQAAQPLCGFGKATTILQWPWLRAIPKTLLGCLPPRPRLPCSQGC